MRLRTIAGLLLSVLLVGTAPPAQASVTTRGNVILVEDTGKKAGRSKHHATGGGSTSGSKPKYTYLPKEEYRARMKDYRAELAAAVARNGQSLTAFLNCLDRVGTTSCGALRPSALPDAPAIRQAGDPAEPAAPALSPQEMAYIAVARLHLTPPKPQIGPSPDLNRWKMAAVGYPLWLSASGNLDPAPVADSVADISVSLDARLVKVVFDMGDGHKITCTDLGTPWTPAVTPGAASPSCGYRYPKPSLPDGSYTVTANTVWAIDWTITGTSGTIPFSQSASTTVPVGELQVLTR